MTFYFKILLIAAVFVSGIFVFPDNLLGYDIVSIPNTTLRNDFVLSPAKIDLALAPGTSREVILYVTNRMGRAATFTLSTEDMIGDDSNGVTLLGNDRGPQSIKDIISFSEKTFSINHGEQAAIPVTVQLSPTAEPGGVYGSVIVSTQSIGEQAGTRAIVNNRLGALFLVRVSGAANENGQVSLFDLVDESRFFFSPIAPSFVISYANNGNVHLNPYGGIDIKNIVGKTLKVPVEPWFVLPEATRTRVVETRERLHFGRYTATLYLNKGYGDRIEERSVVFWVIPKWVLALLTLCVFIGWFVWYRKRLRRGMG